MLVFALAHVRCRQNLIQTPPMRQKHGYIHSEFLEIFGSVFDHQSKLDRGIYGTRLGKYSTCPQKIWHLSYPDLYTINA